MRPNVLWLLAACPIAATAASTVTIPTAVPVCPPPSYTNPGVPFARHYNNSQLALFGPTPASTPGKCDIATIKAATATCPAGALSHYAYDYFDFWSDTNPPINRVFRQEMHIDSFLGIPVGDRLKFAEVTFLYGEAVRFYFDRAYSWYSDVTVTYTACDTGCSEEEVDRFAFPVGLPLNQAVPVTITWTTGRHVQTARNVAWTFGLTFPNTPIGQNAVELAPGTREVSFSNGLIRGSCAGSSATRVRYIQPRFEPY